MQRSCLACISIMSKPTVLIDPQPRTGPMHADMLEKALPQATILIGQTDLPQERLERASKLRAGVVDFEALTDVARSGHLKVATDVFPEEPFAKDHPIRDLPNVVLSAHRSGGIQEAFYEIGRMVLADVELLLRGLPPISCRIAQPETVRRFRSKAVTVS